MGAVAISSLPAAGAEDVANVRECKLVKLPSRALQSKISPEISKSNSSSIIIFSSPPNIPPIFPPPEAESPE
jgi:hypothetical protein